MKGSEAMAKFDKEGGSDFLSNFIDLGTPDM